MSDFSLSSWFLNSLHQYRQGRPTLPRPPIYLYPHILVTGDRCYEALENAVQQTIAYQNGESPHPSPRYLTGALQNDLRRLYQIVAENLEVSAHADGT